MNMASWLTLADIGLARPSYGSYCRCVSVVSVTALTAEILQTPETALTAGDL